MKIIFEAVCMSYIAGMIMGFVITRMLSKRVEIKYQKQDIFEKVKSQMKTKVPIIEIK